MRRAIFLILIGLGGAAVLLSLGIWQVQRLAWKESVIAGIEARIADDPVALPTSPDPQADSYLPVTATGRFTDETLRVLVSQKVQGAGYRLITPFETGGRRVMVDRGFIVTDAALPPLPSEEVTVRGNLQWPQETDGFTPDPDRDSNIWFARDVPLMAEVLGTDPVLIVARDLQPSEPGVTPFPVDSARIPNDHLNYAMTWFSLAAIWLAMSFLFFLRRRRDAQTES
ncbi:MAG: SURF1 family protein [Sulfitobacter sp.]|nr:SURF1 family protein [Sulfitobacter sp.]